MTTQPLAGTLVIDLSRYLPGPLTAKMLANLGARVLKVEEPEFGDPVRLSPPMVRGASTLARLLLSGVESVALDLKQEPARAVLQELLARADVLLESFRPGKLAEFGLAGEVLERRFPRLVVCSISGWGNCGPMSARTGHDLTYQAAAGCLAATGEMPNLPSADLLGAFGAVSAVSAALFARERTGRGTTIDMSLYDAAVVGNLTSVAAAASGLRRGGKVGRPAPLTGAYPCYRLYDTADGRRFALAALEPRFWRDLCRSLNRPDLVPLQYRRDPDSHRRVADLFRTRSAQEWSDLCRGRDLPGEIVSSLDEAARSEQAQARGLDLREGILPFPGLLAGYRPAAGGRFPNLGEHTRSVLAEFGSQARDWDRKRLRSAGIGRRMKLRQAVTRWVVSRFGA